MNAAVNNLKKEVYNIECRLLKKIWDNLIWCNSVQTIKLTVAGSDIQLIHFTCKRVKFLCLGTVCKLWKLLFNLKCLPIHYATTGSAALNKLKIQEMSAVFQIWWKFDKLLYKQKILIDIPLWHSLSTVYIYELP